MVLDNEGVWLIGSYIRRRGASPGGGAEVACAHGVYVCLLVGTLMYMSTDSITAESSGQAGGTDPESCPMEPFDGLTDLPPVGDRAKGDDFPSTIGQVRFVGPVRQRTQLAMAAGPPSGRDTWSLLEGVAWHETADARDAVRAFFSGAFSVDALKGLAFIHSVSVATGAAKEALCVALVAALVAPVRPKVIRAWLMARREYQSGVRGGSEVSSEEIEKAAATTIPPTTPGQGGQMPPPNFSPTTGGEGGGTGGSGTSAVDAQLRLVQAQLELVQAQERAARAARAQPDNNLNALVDEMRRSREAREEKDRREAARLEAEDARATRSLLERTCEDAVECFRAGTYFDVTRLDKASRVRMLGLRHQTAVARIAPNLLVHTGAGADAEAELSKGSKAPGAIEQGFVFLIALLASQADFPRAKLADLAMWWSRLTELVVPGVRLAQKLEYAAQFNLRYAGKLGVPSSEEPGVGQWSALVLGSCALKQEYLQPSALMRSAAGGPYGGGGGGGGARGKGPGKESPAKRAKTSVVPMKAKFCWEVCKKGHTCPKNGVAGGCKMSHFCPCCYFGKGLGTRVQHSASDCPNFDNDTARKAASGALTMPPPLSSRPAGQ